MFKKSSTKNLGHVYGLDGLRAIAIIGIVLYHTLPQYISGGFYGVLIFFLITGYLLAHKTKNELDRNRYSFNNFYQKKIWRLYPALLITIIITFSCILLFLPKFSKALLQDTASILCGYNNFWQIKVKSDYFSAIQNASPFTHLWYLSIIMQVYFLWPIFVAIFCIIRKKHKNVHAWPVLLILTILSGLEMALLYSPENITRIYYGLDTRLCAVLFGMLIGSLDQKTFDFIGKRSHWLKASIFAICVIITCYIFVIADGNISSTYCGGMQAATLLFGFMLILILTTQDTLAKIIDMPPLSWIGKISYEIYLVMYPTIYIFHQLLKNNNSHSEYVLFVCIQLAVIIAIATVIHIIVVVLELFKPKKKKIARPIIVIALLIATLTLAFVQNYLASIHKGVSDMQEMQTEFKANEKKLDEVKHKKADKVSNPEDITQMQFTAIGDSVMLGAAATIQTNFPNAVIDAKESRQFVTAIDICKDLKANNQLNDTVIIGLGTNGPFKEEKGQELLDYLGKDRTIYWVGTYGASLSWQSEVNDTIKSLCNSNKNVTYIDWASYAEGHSDWFYSDGIHLKTAGQQGYCDMLKEYLGK